MKIDMKNRPILRELDDGLMLCRSRREDAEALAEFNSRIHSDDGFDQPDTSVGAWTRDLLEKPHPTFQPEDFTLVAEAKSGKIISAMNLISQTWAYEGIPFKVGRPELVGTLPEFRKRGLVRLQFEEIHRWSADRGEQLQAITGIPYYYRLFGYEMCLELGGSRVGFEPQVPVLKEGESEPFTVRPAVEADIPFIQEMYALNCQRKLVSAVRDEALWRYELCDQDARNVNRLEYRILTRSGTQEPVGFLAHPWFNWGGGGLMASVFELKPGISWLEAAPNVIRYLWDTGATYRMPNGKETKRTSFGFHCGTEHPVYEICRNRLPEVRRPYAFFIRIADLMGFLKTITPALERHIAQSDIPGYSGECTLGFYSTGIRLTLKDGKMTGVEPWQPEGHDFGAAAFAGLTFLQLLTGYRNLDDLRAAFPDCYYINDETRVLLHTLFPKKASDVLFIN